METIPTQANTLSGRTCQRSNQNLPKSLQSQRTERNCFKKFADTKKIKNADTRADTKDRKYDDNDTETE